MHIKYGVATCFVVLYCDKIVTKGVMRSFNYFHFECYIRWSVACIFMYEGLFRFSDKLVKENLYSANSNLFISFFLAELYIHSSIPCRTLLLASWNFIYANSLYFFPLEMSLHSLLFPFNDISPITVWLWFLSTYGYLLQLDNK